MSLDTQGRVIYSGTFSKVFSPILRLGFLAVPKALAPAFREGRLSHGAPPSLMVQPALADFIESGAFAIHIRRMRRIYAARRKALLAALAPDDGLLYHVDAAPSGLTLLLRLPPGVSDEAVAKRLKAAGIEALTLSSHYANPRRDHGLLLSFAGFDDQQLARAGQRLRDILSDN
jgi:GntR family transcriptional regulator/MocR family aminotransferase